MKICHLSTLWPNRFGHTHHTDNLIRVRLLSDCARLMAEPSPC